MKLLALLKKEFHRFFHDRRLIVTMLLPGIIIFVLYSILGEAFAGGEEEHEYKVYLGGSSAVTALIEEAAKGSGSVEWLPLTDEERAREEVKSGEATAILVFSENFDLFPADASVRLVYEPMEEGSSAFYALASATLNAYGMRFAVLPESLSGVKEIGMDVLREILPFILVCFVFSAGMSVTLESVAGEKERGTLSTVLVTSVRRSDVALGKILPLSCISMLGALSSFLGMALSMPRLMGVDLGFFGGYAVWSYVLLFFLLISTVPFVVGLIATVSTLSRSVKEASAYTSALMILTMVVSLIAAFVPKIGDWVVAVPVFNAVVCMQGVLGGGLPVWQSLVSVGVNCLFTALLIWVMTKLLSSERVMFGK